MPARNIWLGCFILAVTSLAPVQLQAQYEYPLCQARHNAIGEVPGRPFTALVVEETRRIQPDGKAIPLGASELPAGLVARDSNGRVMVASKIAITQEADGEVRKWSETICDPLNRTVTTAVFRAIVRSPGSNPQDLYISNDAEGNAWVRPQGKVHTTAVFAAWHNRVNGRENLGEETFEGLPAYRYRLTGGHEEGSLRDIVNSDQISLQLEETNWKTYPVVEDVTHLTEIRVGEPLQALFDLSPAVHVHGIGFP